MADKKISQLTNLTGADLADVDEFAVVDASATETKAITFGELKTALDTSTGFVRITGDTMTGALDVQSTITADGLTVDGDARFTGTVSTLNYPNSLLLDYFPTVTGTRIFSIGPDSSTEGQLEFHTSTTTANKKRLSIATGGDISFYEDTGTTPKFFWDASAESLQLGTGAAVDCGVWVNKSSTDAIAFLRNNAATSTGNGLVVDMTNTPLTYIADFRIGNASKVRIDSSGNVGIGTSSPAEKLQVDGNIRLGPAHTTRVGTDGVNAYFENFANGAVVFRTNGYTERMRITSTGNVGIGTSSPSAPLSVDSTGAVIKLNQSNVAADTYIDMRASSAVFGYDSSKLAATIQAGAGNKFISFNVNNNTFGDGEAARIDSSGNLLVAKTSANNTAVGTTLYSSGAASHVASGGITTLFNRLTSDGDITVFQKDGSTVGSIGTAGGDLTVGTGNVRLRFNDSGDEITPRSSDDSGRDAAIDIGTGTIRFKDLYLSGASNAAGFQSNQSITGFGYINFGDTDDSNIGQIGYDHTSNYMRFQVNNAERLRIDSSGNLLVGATSFDNDLAGIGLGASNFFYATRSGSIVGSFNRLTSDGTIIDFRKDGSTVGSIGSVNGVTAYIDGGSGFSGIQFGNDGLVPRDNGAVADATSDLGTSSKRFKDLYLSGGVYLGGTGAANYLDDYETGTCTISLDGATGSFTATYVKVGKLVQLSVELSWTGTPSSDNLSGLPFTPKNAAFASVDVMNSGNYSSGYRPVIRVRPSDFRILKSNGNAHSASLTSEIPTDFTFTITYQTDA